MGIRTRASWMPHLNFISIHYAWVIFCAVFALPVMMPYGNLAAIDAFFFGASASTESGLNTIDVKNIPTYQQVYIYVIPVITNLLFINAMVVPVRLFWFNRRLKQAVDALARRAASAEATATSTDEKSPTHENDGSEQDGKHVSDENASAPEADASRTVRSPTITWDNAVRPDVDSDAISPVQRADSAKISAFAHGPVLQAARSIERAASSAFVLGSDPRRRSRSQDRNRSSSRQRRPQDEVPELRISNFSDLSESDLDVLGGVEYRALKMLLYFVFGQCRPLVPDIGASRGNLLFSC
ncbi:high-affinity potassium transport protein [Colletotrichum liriopes]|uniref:High-affinity potassium transport protein n=1 Tax=Colletotrichum liriopes TaxID=708192 RepID=A0AA37GKA3_9PEZI|nr:high-affinity potassium transport protein [Colletotrichum liriopes]